MTLIFFKGMNLLVIWNAWLIIKTLKIKYGSWKNCLKYIL